VSLNATSPVPRRVYQKGWGAGGSLTTIAFLFPSQWIDLSSCDRSASPEDVQHVIGHHFTISAARCPRNTEESRHQARAAVQASAGGTQAKEWLQGPQTGWV
jgi:hypothetical protein